ncbi:hypothetical protein GCM10010492_40540 [Saccharothrix mutabilis subsp. mutabilis]|uniref:Uncharacterized protein n=1 Tax=Saccharothrix mutabilis subsp. mutabilis TaxID=66855 RepID=A0ABP3DRS9_9PSEU
MRPFGQPAGNPTNTRQSLWHLRWRLPLQIDSRAKRTNNRIRNSQRSTTSAPGQDTIGEDDPVTSSQPPHAKLVTETSILIKS